MKHADVDVDPRTVAVTSAAIVSPDRTTCVVCRSGVAVRSPADLVQLVVLLERMGVNVLDMGRPRAALGTLTSVASGGLVGEHLFLPFEPTV
jgi:hypothetical protein